MRRFVVVGHKASSSGDFKLDDMAGGAGRLDILLRCVNSAFFLSHGIRKDAEIYLVLQGPPAPTAIVRFVGSDLKYLNPDERSTGALVRTALLKMDGREWTRSSPGVSVSRRSLGDLLAELSAHSRMLLLKEDGAPLDGMGAEDVTFVLSDNQDLAPAEEELVNSLSAGSVRLGPLSLHADHCIILAHNALDRAAQG